LGGFIGEVDVRDKLIDAKISTRKDNIQQLSSIAGAYPQSTYAAIQKLVQAEWTFL
jgi:hypothetical protein